METIGIYVIHSDHGPVRLSVNGVKAEVPVGVDHPLDTRLLPALRDAAGIRWRYVGEAGGGDDAGGRAVLAAEAVSILDNDGVISLIPDLTPQQLLSVRDEESGRDEPRATVLRAIDKAIAATNEG